jgi:hypothetical protein
MQEIAEREALTPQTVSGSRSLHPILQRSGGRVS